MMKEIKGGVLAAQGFRAAGIAAGLKNSNKKDMALLVADEPATTAMVVTQNVVKAAPVLWDMKVMAQTDKISAVVVNSGNANASTGEQGLADSEATANKVAEVLGLSSADKVLVSSTGVIGVELPTQKIMAGVESLAAALDDDEASAEDAATAIMTTDTVQKTLAVEFELDGKTVRLGGMVKGSGMICPNMATMLCYLTTDAALDGFTLKQMLRKAVNDTFNMISIDGDMSTNDTVVVMASGAADNAVIDDVSSADGTIFYEALYFLCESLAKMVVRDGEGATKLIEVEVMGAKTLADARKMAKMVVDSNLVKTAFFGADANWGRVLMAMGASGAEFDPNKVSLTMSSSAGMLTLLNDGTPIVFDEDEAKRILSEEDINVGIALDDGFEKATAWGCDLSYDYVKINGDYRS